MRVLAVASAVLGLTAAGCTERKKVLQWGWDEPDTAYLRMNIQEMERSPFDGCVFSVRYRSGETSGSFTWEFWGRRRFERRDVAGALADLRALRPRRFKHNFLRVNATPGDLDWSEDFSPVVANAALAADLARAGRAKGILLDVEQYKGRLFDFVGKSSRTRSWDEDSARARLWGHEIMSAFQRGYPNLTVFLTFGYTLPWVLSDQGHRPLAETPYGLLAPFIDGMVEASAGRTLLVDGYELAYGFRSAQQYGQARRLFATGVLPIVRRPDAYRARFRLAFGLWLDYDWRRLGWHAQDNSRNYFSPDAFEASLSSALRDTDEYVWIYNETPRWWGTVTDAAPRVPEAYQATIRRARQRSH